VGRNLKTAALGQRRQGSEYVNSRAQTNAAFRTKTVNIRNHQTPGIINITELDGAEPPKPRTAASTNDHLHSFATTTKNPRLHSPPQQPARSRAESSQRTRRSSSNKKGSKNHFVSNQISLKSRISYLEDNSLKEAKNEPETPNPNSSSLTSVQIKLNKLHKKSIEYPTISKSAYDQNNRIHIQEVVKNPI
jgi:hypothetical protein